MEAADWQEGGGVWALVDEHGSRIGWITRRGCCYFASIEDPTKARSFVRLDDAQRYIEKEMKLGRTNAKLRKGAS